MEWNERFYIFKMYTYTIRKSFFFFNVQIFDEMKSIINVIEI